jgi:fibronectin-binding autotransporter adhesin
MASRSQILSDNQTSFPNNNSALITPQVLRDFNADFANSVVFNDQTGSMSVANAVSASYALTASFALNGGGGGTINTGSFATTGSNTFTGPQTYNATSNFNAPIFVGNQLIFTASRFSSTVANSADIEILDQNRFGFNVKDKNAVTSGSEFTATVDSGSLYASVDFNTYYGGKIGSLELRNDNGFRSLVIDVDTTFITGSTTISSLSGNLNGTASFATTASFALNAGTTVSTGSLLTTASVSLNTITFTKGDGSTFPITVNTGSGGAISTGSFATTGSNTFIGSQTITGSISATGNIITDGSLRSNNGNTFTGSQQINGSTFQTGSISVTTNITAVGNIIATGSLRSNSGNTFVGSQEITGSTFQSGSTFQTGSITVTGNGSFGGSLRSGTANTFTGSQNITGSTFQAGDIQLGGVININQTGQLGAGENILLGYSGSLVLAASTTGPTYANLSHISASSLNFPNLIFKSNTNTASTIVSGSNNIFVNAAAATAGFIRYVGGSGNIALAAATVPQISQSMAFSPTMNNNFLGGTITLRGPVSSSVAYNISNNNILTGVVLLGDAGTGPLVNVTRGLTFTGNNINGNLSLSGPAIPLASAISITNTNINGTAFYAALSSSITAANNNINDNSATITNGYFSGSAGTGSLTFSNNALTGLSNTVNIIGSIPGGGTANPVVNLNTMTGGNNTIFINATNSASGSTPRFSAVRNIIGGNNLVVTGSSSALDLKTAGSAFFGRYNLNDGILNTTSDTVFAVGTGTDTTRRTSLHISSSGLTSVRDSLNVTGSLTVGVTTPELQVLATGVTLGNVVTDAHTITGSLSISGSLRVNGNLQYNVGAFFSTASQSGSAGVSQSMTFDTTDISSGVSIASNSRITLANAGTYNIQFSAQTVATGGADNLYIWLKKNGTNVAASAGNVEIVNNAEIIAAWNYVVNAAAGDYYELCWQAGNTGTILLAAVASGNIPAIPSIILTVTQVR